MLRANHTSLLHFGTVWLLAGLVSLLPATSGRSRLGASILWAQHVDPKAARPEPPTRDPNSPGYVKAKELPDGSIPAADADGNFIIGPSHPVAAEMSAGDQLSNGTVIEFTTKSSDSKIYPGIAREPNTFGTADPANPAQAGGNDESSGCVHPEGRRIRPQAIRTGQ